MAALDDALAIRRREKALKDVPEKERLAVSRLLRKTALLGHHARSQAPLVPRTFGHSTSRSFRAS